MNIYPKRPAMFAPRPFTAIDCLSYSLGLSINAAATTHAYMENGLGWAAFCLGAWVITAWCILVRVHEAQEKR